MPPVIREVGCHSCHISCHRFGTEPEAAQLLTQDLGDTGTYGEGMAP